MTIQSPDDTIAAISTPPGEGGIGIVRLSGNRAVAIAGKLFVSSKNRRIECDTRAIFYGHIVDGSGHAVDEVLLHVMRAPNSYTREDVVEINGHGGATPLGAILDLALVHGARLAEPGEFTLRAFLNGRIDLVQAEAVIDRITAKSRAGLLAAAAAASGTVSKAINEIKAILVDALTRIEAAVDFPDEDLPDLVDRNLKNQLEAARERVRRLLDTAEAGRLYREGAAIAIAGPPNVGKSSLFNALLRDARAIVSAIPGTTRDRIEETIVIAGVPVRLTDTAGLRSAPDEIEQMGIEIARHAMNSADIVLFVVDAACAASQDENVAKWEFEDVDCPVWIVVNKIDLLPSANAPAWAEKYAGTSFVSAFTGEGLAELENSLGKLLLGTAPIVPEQGMINRAHQRDSLRRASVALDRLLSNFEASPECLSIDLRDAVNALGEITGETTPEDILEQIFSSFCIGK